MQKINSQEFLHNLDDNELNMYRSQELFHNLVDFEDPDIHHRDQKSQRVIDIHSRDKYFENVENIEFIDKQMTIGDQYFLESVLEKHFLFEKANDFDQIEKLAQKAKYCRNTQEILYTEDSIAGLFFIIAEGKVERFYKQNSRGILAKGEYFGDFDIYSGQNRSATTKCIGDCYFWVLDSHDYMHYAKSLIQLEKEENRKYIIDHQFFKTMSQQQREEILRLIFTKIIKIGSKFVEENTIAEDFYIIKEGKVKVTKDGEEIAIIGPGKQIGYDEFMRLGKYEFSFTALNHNIKCIKINRLTIQRFMAKDISAFLNHNLQRYAIETHNLLNTLTQFEIEKIIKESKIMDYKNNQILVKNGQSQNYLYIIMDGKVVNENDESIFYVNGDAIYNKNITNGNLIVKQNSIISQSKLNEDMTFEALNETTKSKPIRRRTDTFIRKISVKHSPHSVISLARIGSGSYGDCHLCKSLICNEICTIKVIPKQMTVLNRQENQQIQEKKVMEIIGEHPMIVQYYGTFKDDYNVYLMMESINGIEFFDVLRLINGSLKPDVVAFYGAALICILEYLHSLDIIYRDFKAENIMIDDQGYPKLIDFGASKILKNKGQKNFTMTGTSIYMAPEVIEGKGYTQYVDLWALGVLLYESLCGPPPFGDDDDPFVIYQNIINKQLTFPSFVKDEPTIQFISQLLHKRPFKRLGGSYDLLKQNIFFEKQKIDWNKIQTKEMVPPFLPPIERLFEMERVKELEKGAQKLSDIIKITPYDKSKEYQCNNWDDEF